MTAKLCRMACFASRHPGAEDLHGSRRTLRVFQHCNETRFSLPRLGVRNTTGQASPARTFMLPTRFDASTIDMWRGLCWTKEDHSGPDGFA